MSSQAWLDAGLSHGVFVCSGVTVTVGDGLAAGLFMVAVQHVAFTQQLHDQRLKLSQLVL